VNWIATAPAPLGENATLLQLCAILLHSLHYLFARENQKQPEQ